MIDISKVSGNQIDKAGILHTSGIRKAVQGYTFGATSSETFAARQRTAANRRHVGDYSSANLHTDYRAQVRPFNSGTRADVTPAARPAGPVGAASQRSFHDSSRHRPDPYAH